MKKTKPNDRLWLVLDTSYLAYRAQYSTGRLEQDGIKTGVLYGVLRELTSLQDKYCTRNVVFCFDHKPYARTSIHQNYKVRLNRIISEAEEEIRQEVKRQIGLLRTEYLERIGYQNVFAQRGYEADDVIASVVQNLKSTDRAIVVSADQDLYQLLGRRVSIHNPAIGEVYTAEDFAQQHGGLKPEAWVTVKALAGCSSDNVPGCERVGVKTAVRYLTEKLNKEHTAYRRIKEWLRGEQYPINRRLVRIPYPGCRPFTPKQEHIDTKHWDEVVRELGMPSLRTKFF